MLTFVRFSSVSSKLILVSVSFPKCVYRQGVVPRTVDCSPVQMMYCRVLLAKELYKILFTVGHRSFISMSEIALKSVKVFGVDP